MENAEQDTSKVKVDQDLVDKLKIANPDVQLLGLGSDSATIVAKSPQKKEMDLFRDMMFNEKTRARGMERIVRACVLHPVGEELNRLIDGKPNLVEKWAEELLKSGGAEEEIQVKKL